MILPQHILEQVFQNTVKGFQRNLCKANLCFGVCRSGTTALAQVYGKAGFKAHYQPVKADFRLISNGDSPRNFPLIAKSGSARLFFKETFGPFFSFETEIDFLSIYVALGLQIKTSHFIIAFRDPAGTFASWLRQWGDTQSRKELFEIYIKAETASINIERLLLHKKLKITYYCHHHSQTGLQNFDRLFQRSVPSTEFRPNFLRNWRTTNLSRSKVIFPKEPAFFFRKDIHETTPFFYAPPGTYIEFSESEQRRLDEENIFTNYNRRLGLAANSHSNTYNRVIG